MLIDNKKDRYPNDGRNIVTVWDFINEFSGKKSEQEGQLDIVTGYFTIRALSKLYHDIPENDKFRIVSSEMVKRNEDSDHIIDLLNGDLSISNALAIDQYAQDAKAFLSRNTVQIKAIVNAFCHAKAYMFHNNKASGNKYYLTGSSNLTDAGLGLKSTSNVELTIGNVSSVNDNDFNEVCSWFEDIWNMATDQIPLDPSDTNSEKISVKEYFIKKIEDYFRKYTPQEIYYKILFELFNSDLDLEGGIEHQKDMNLLQTSIIWNTLFNYQQKGVISLIKMLRKYNGAILADAVGLGKTFSALAVIKYFQIQNYTTILLCPKKLEHNWKQYLHGAQSRFEKDEFNYHVRFHTDLQNGRMERAYERYKLSYLQSRKKVLIVIDESHNLRNEKSGRYIDLMNTLIQNQYGQDNREVKILMLSATPINTGLNDIKGQFKLIAHGNDHAFNNEEFDVESLDNTFADAQRKYTTWCADPNRTIGQFVGTLPQRFFNLTDKLIVARTRSLIENTLGENLGFPKKKCPTNIYQGVDHFGSFHNAEDIYKAFEDLSLTAYQPSRYLYATQQKARKEASTDWNDDVNREQFLVKMMCVLFLKRLESSWFSLKITIKKVLDVHESTLKKVLEFENGVDSVIRYGENLNNDEDEELEEYSRRRQIKVSDIVNIGGFKKGLQMDCNKLRAIYQCLVDFQEKYFNQEERDLKLEKLVSILDKKRQYPNKKVVIFTAYSDTARFLYEELSKRGFSHIALATGQEILTMGKHSKRDFTEILQSFAPYSKLFKEMDWDSLYEKHLNASSYYNEEKHRWEVTYAQWQLLVEKYQPKIAQLLKDKVDILIATDCLSEGQNLQDADMQINYDIHWNPVRLIQRFGRIDRIGSPNEEISCVNFWPAKSLEEYLKLETRIQNRMTLMNLVGSETQEVNEEYAKMIADNPLQDRNADRLLEELAKNSISDIESNQTLSLKDFSFEIYRQDLVEYFEQNKDVFRKMPNGIYSGFVNAESTINHIPESVVAVVGYPHREQGDSKAYKEIYLICQKVNSDESVDFKVLNKAEILNFLRQYKNADRFVPEWIESNDIEKLSKIQSVIQEWMKQKAPNQVVNTLRNRFKSRRLKKATEDNQTIEEKFQMQNFDLIAWEYISK